MKIKEWDVQLSCIQFGRVNRLHGEAGRKRPQMGARVECRWERAATGECLCLCCCANSWLRRALRMLSWAGDVADPDAEAGEHIIVALLLLYNTNSTYVYDISFIKPT